MKRLLLILLTFSLFNNSVIAQESMSDRFPQMTFGVEWGYIGTFHTGYHYNYFAPEGFRVDDEGNRFGYWHNADMYAHIGCNFNLLWNLSLYIGYAGIGNLHNALPVSLRATRYFGKNRMDDGWLAFVDLGSGICLKRPIQEIITGKIGGGYRISLSRDTKLDFIFSVRTTYTHPYIYYEDTMIPNDRINRNNAYLNAISIGMALTF